jgi:hypothetical protein
MDVETGAEIFRVQSEAEERLADFDGRFIVLTNGDRRWDVPLDQLAHVQVGTIIDVTGSNPDHIVDGRVRLVRNDNRSATRQPSLSSLNDLASDQG